MLSLLTVAALTPETDSITIIDEQIETVPFDEDFDLVGITVMTATAPRAYELCSHFTARGIPVVLGGFHPTFNQKEALRYASSIVIGPAYGAWTALVEDYRNNKPKKIYRGNPKAGIPARLPRHLMKRKGYITGNATLATLGCTNTCRFCSITAFYSAKKYERPIQDVVSEVKSFKPKFFMFVDDNLTQNREYIIELCKALAPLKKKWISQASVEIADDEELLEHLQKAGCAGFFIGLESLSAQALDSQEKTIKSPEMYKQAIRKIHRYGIFIESGVVFGFDTDTTDVFAHTLKVLEQIGLDAIQVSILTPLPGTLLHQDMKDRIDDTNWEHYDYKYAVYQPALMTKEELKAGSQWVRRGFYSPPRILKRLIRWLAMPGAVFTAIYPLVLNIAYWGRLGRFHVRGYDPARQGRRHVRRVKEIQTEIS